MNPVNSVFKSYKQRLISMDSRNSSFFLSRLMPKKHVDIIKIAEMFNIIESIEKDLYQKGVLEIVRPNYDIKKIESLIYENPEQVFETLKKIIIPLKKEDAVQIELLLKKETPEDQIKLHLKKIVQSYDELNFKTLKQFESIFNQSRATEREFGKNDLYLGFPFIEGKFQSDKDFRAPLVLHRVSIKNSTDKVIITILKEGRLINPVFLLSYLNENRQDYKQFDYEIPEEITDFTNYALEKMKSYNIDVEDTVSVFEKIQSMTKLEYKNKFINKINQFKIQRYVVLGTFPLSNRNIYNDLDTLEKQPISASESLNEIIYGGSHFDFEDRDTNLKEEAIKYISPIDWSQRVVIKKALEGNLVVEGPPGTGKSQTIVNIIVNLLLQNKKILVVSEKVAAIEVVYNRLGRLKDFVLLIEDHIKNKDDFYNQIKKLDQIKNESQQAFSYDSTIDYSIQEYLDNLKLINDGQFFKNYSYEDVLKIAENPHNVTSTSKHLSLIKSYINLIEIDNNRLEESLDTLLQPLNIKKFKSYQEIKHLDIFSMITQQQINFFSKFIDSLERKMFIQFNHYLVKIKRNPINAVKIKNIENHIHTIQTTYDHFDQFVNKTFEKTNKFKEKLKILSDILYKDIVNNMARINLVISWPKLSGKEKDKEIISVFRLNEKTSFINKFINKKLTQNEIEFKDFIQNYQSALDYDALKIIQENFFETDLILALSFIKNSLNTLDDMYNLAFDSNLFEFKDASFDKIYNQVKNDFKSIDITLLQQYQDTPEEALAVLEVFNETNVSKDTFKNLVLNIYIGKEKLQKAIDIKEYFFENKVKLEGIKQKLNDKYEESEQLVFSKHQSKVKDRFRTHQNYFKEFNLLIEQANNKRRKPIKTIFSRYLDTLLFSFPIMLMTPDVVSGVFDLKQDLFDYVIFDEASQLFIERAIPAIYRSNKVIVAGDSKQLKPSSTFISRLSESGEYDDDLGVSNEELEALDKESLLEMAKTKYISKMLQFHYRSDYKELIEFSSVVFYDRKLIFASKLNNALYSNTPIEVIQVDDGIWTSERNNPKEAEEVVKLVLSLLENRTSNETIGIVTFNINQKSLIQDLLEDASNTTLNEEMNRVNEKTNHDESLFVKNIENVQGDERDIIIFSIGYAKNHEGLLKASFGLLNNQGGENRLNVAVTRAKRKIFVVKSFQAKDLRINDKNNGPHRFKQYLQYAELVHERNEVEKQVLLNSINDFNRVNMIHTEQFDSQFEEEVYKSIESRISSSLLIKTQVNEGGYKIDQAIYDKNTERFILGIECDGYYWHSKPEDVERDFHRQQYLESRGWTIVRIMSTNWWMNREEEIAKVLRVLEAKQTTMNN